MKVGVGGLCICMTVDVSPLPTLKTNGRVIWSVNSTRRESEPYIPVLTKPDWVEPGDEGKWPSMLRSRTDKFKHAGFVSAPKSSPLSLCTIPPSPVLASSLLRGIYLQVWVLFGFISVAVWLFVYLTTVTYLLYIVLSLGLLEYIGFRLT